MGLVAQGGEQWQETGRGVRDFLLAGRCRRRERRRASLQVAAGAPRPGPEESGPLKLE